MPFRDCKWYWFDDDKLPAAGGVYGVADMDRAVIYVGRTSELSRRIGEHRNDQWHCMHRYVPVYLLFEPVSTEWGRVLRERELIAEYDPPCNKTS